MAKDFLREKGVSMVIDPEEKKSMTRTPVKKQGDHTYIDAKTGEGYREKPENMTHLRGNLLVMKTHPGSLSGERWIRSRRKSFF